MTLKRKNEIKLRLTDKELEQLNEDVKKTGYSREEFPILYLQKRLIIPFII